MYTVQENVCVVIALLKEYNIQHIVISPGGTNIPISQAVQNDPFFHCYSVPDERSAMYFAIGLYLQLGVPIATSCTSAQATRNYVPGLTEAFYKHVPILAITTAKLECFQYQDYMQAPDQTSLPKDSVKCSFDLPPITDEYTRLFCMREAKQAMLEITHRKPGPIQLNIRIIDKLQNVFSTATLPKIKPVKRYMAWDNWEDLELKNKKILVIIGESRPFNRTQKNAIESFCNSFDTVVYTNHLSNYHGGFSINANLLLATISSETFSTEINPDIIISIGGQTGDYPLFNKLSSLHKDVEHWMVSEDGKIMDTYSRLTKIFECPDHFFFDKIKKEHESAHHYFTKWKTLQNSLNRAKELPLSNLYAAQQIHKLIPKNSYVNFAILNSLRCWSYFDLDHSIQCYSNVGAFGIDGCTSTLIGESMNTDELCFLITGDLAFFYDLNSLGIRHIKNNVRILLINNNGGAEFKIMTAKWKENLDTSQYISADGHNGNAKGWAENCGFKYVSASSKQELEELQSTFVSQSDKSIILELFTTEEDDAMAVQSFLEGDYTPNLKSRIKDAAKSIIGDKGVECLKKILK